MEFILAEEFLKQDKKVQRVFTDYFDHKEMLFEDGSIYFGTFNYLYTPLLTEGDLREFIEDKTSELAKVQCKMKIEYKTKDEIEKSKSNSNLSLQSQEGYFIQITSTEFMGGIMKFHDLGTDLLKAYWQVACKIAYEKLLLL